MALTTKLVMRQSQSLVMTPQLLQAIKLLQFSNLDLTAFIEEELERNPLLERAEDSPESPGLDGADINGGTDPAGISPGEDFREAAEADGSSASLPTTREALEASLSTEYANTFDDGRTPTPGEYSLEMGRLGLSATAWPGPSGGTGDGAAANLEATIAASANLKDHLEMQLRLATAAAADRLTGQVLIDSIDENGYFTGSLDEIAARLHLPLQQAERILRLIQGFDPTGVGARDLAEC
ncbi:MAG: RNA polymerase factor sigma-54, partial [Methylocella sp.]